jgi:hypothetical protein
MRWVLALVALAAGVAANAPGAPATSEVARVALLDRSPVVVRGVRFRTRETVTVRVVIRGGASSTKPVRAGAGGTWTARFPALSAGHCAAVVVRATGARGSRAAYTELPPPCGAAP